VGTGPYRLVDFRPGDMLRAEANTAYHVTNQPHFDALELKGGGDATSAARSVLQTGDFDFGWGLFVEDDLLKRMEAAGKGKAVFLVGSDLEHIGLNATDPWTEVDGERASLKSHHPAFSDKAVRQAISLLVDRSGMQEVIFGRGAIATSNFLNNPPAYRSPNTKAEFNIDKAGQLLESAGWKKGADGIRAKGQAKLKFVFQTSINPSRQKAQAIIKNACAKAGIELELKGVAAAVFFGSDASNPDTYQKFWADMQMYSNQMQAPDPQLYMEQLTSAEIPQKANKWSGRNPTRWSNAEYDALHKASQGELDPVKRAALFIRMNDLAVAEAHIVPVFARPRPHGYVNKLVPVLSPWDSALASLGYWYKDA
jgi:peptide/nickel transport system substrate-binding protein